MFFQDSFYAICRREGIDGVHVVEQQEINGTLFQALEKLQDLRSPGNDLHTMSVIEIKEVELRIKNQVQ